jgi:DNA-binding response OmpR family regulator
MDGSRPTQASEVRFRALVVERDPDYSLAIQAVVMGNGCRVDVVEDIDDGLRELQRNRYNIVVLGASADDDVVSAAQRIHEIGPIGLVILDDRLADARNAYEAGADQLLPKPFVPGQLAGALRAALRSRGPDSIVAVARSIRVDNVVFDAERRELRFDDGEKVRFSGREWELLSVLISKSNQYFTAEELRDEAWGEPSLSLDQVRGYVRRIRAKLADHKVRFGIVTARSLGYCMRITSGQPVSETREAHVDAAPDLPDEGPPKLPQPGV